ncbi:hypothetical protein EZS27_044360, partial [termite gut metagenome]
GKGFILVFHFLLIPPHLNIAETIWRKLKKEWLNPEDYLNKDSLFYAVNRAFANLGTNLNIRFSKFNKTQKSTCFAGGNVIRL